MTHRGTRKEPPTDALYEATLRLVDGAIETLASRQDDQAVHLARKATKRIRAALRLMRQSLGTAIYHRENRRVRDAARPLTALRDAFMLRRALRKMPSRSAPLEHGLKFEYRREREAFTRQGSQAALTQLRAARRHLGERGPNARQVASTAEAVGETYRAGRKARTRARSNDDPALHEWRKQTTYLLNQLELLRAVFGFDVKKMRRRAHTLAATLGDDHDLSVLCAKLRRYDATTPRLTQHIQRLRSRLQRRAKKQGRKLYRHSAKHIKATLAANFSKLSG